MNSFVAQAKMQLPKMIIMACFFSIVGYYIPKIYLEFLDKKDYIEIRQPVSPEFPSYNRGEKIGLIINRRSFINTVVAQQAKLVHVNGALITRQLDARYVSKDIAIENTKGEWVAIKTDGTYIPCDAIPGRTFIQVVFQYSVDGIAKNYNYVTEVFQVNEKQDPSCQVAR